MLCGSNKILSMSSTGQIKIAQLWVGSMDRGTAMSLVTPLKMHKAFISIELAQHSVEKPAVR